MQQQTQPSPSGHWHSGSPVGTDVRRPSCSASLPRSDANRQRFIVDHTLTGNHQICHPIEYTKQSCENGGAGAIK